MASLTRLITERTDLTDADSDHLHALISEWTLLADLAFADLVLWLPTWNEAGFVAGAQVRPTTGPTAVPQDIVGEFVPRGRHPELDQALALGRLAAGARDDRGLPPERVAIPVRQAGRVIAVVARWSSADSRHTGRLEDVYLGAADDLATMVAEGEFPPPEGVARTGAPPRVGDGLIRLDDTGVVSYASPNAQSAFRRLGVAVDLAGAPLGPVATRLSHRPGPVDEAVAVVAGGRAAGGAEIENPAATVTLRCFPLRRAGRQVGALVLVRDVTEVRRRDRALLTKDATIREIHHRVKNNLQTVAALLRLQSRRLEATPARDALEEAVRRVGSIAVVHEELARETSEVVSFDEVADRVLALVADTAAAHGGAGPAALVRDGSFGSLPADVATPLAMALSELLQNAVQHAGARTVRLSADRTATRLLARVDDDGTGLPPGFDPAASGRLGLQIVQTLVVDELGGSLTLEPGPSGTGTRALVTLALNA